MDADRDQLKNMEERNANLEKDVKKYEERQKTEREVGRWSHFDCVTFTHGNKDRILGASPPFQGI